MIATKNPYGAMSEGDIRFLMPPRQDGKFYIIDSITNQIEVEEETYLKLKKKGVEVYEGTIRNIRNNQL